MALNCSSRSVLLSDECAGMMLGCGCRSEEASPLSSCGVSSLRWDELDLEVEEVDESDPVARLPSDPFEMNLGTSMCVTAAALASALSGAQTYGNGGDDDIFAGLSYYYLNQAFQFGPEPWIFGYMDGFRWSFESECASDSGNDDQFSQLPPSASCSQPSGFEENPPSSQEAALPCCDAVDAAPVQEGNDAHEALTYVLSHLSLRDVLSCEMVCKSLRSAVRSEAYTWKCIHIDSQLGEKISDADLLRLTQKESGVLQCLSLVRCKNITDLGLKAVLQSNPQLTELGIFGNVRITHQGLVDNLRSFNVAANTGIKKLRVANLVTASKAQYEELLSLLKIDKGLALHKQEPRIFHADCFLLDHHGGYAPDYFLPDLHDGYALDIERCPLCENYKLVYDCPAEGCNNSRFGTCRGCLVCIERCLQCGRCIDNEYEETFSLDSLCRSCQMEGDSSVAEK
ncbi:hypothetical protein EJB05_38998 [Eragrostis curvula]|uniref:F-box domain-containing protein n=1 Tax=Eragrostis curvula TaxID=38414 RepID=A0A5J9TVZ8_9POAL|nr:hypothetical protein EJB05_38998 [Eragrostis curvula]